MTTIGFVRHGITEWNELGKVQGRSNIPLNERGKQQAMAFLLLRKSGKLLYPVIWSGLQKQRRLLPRSLD